MYLVCIICGMNSKEIIRRLLQEGWVRDGGQGSHQRFVHPDRPGHVTVPHPRKDFPYGTLPENLLAAIDDYVAKHGGSRSGFLAEAARAKLKTL